jgi:hypothetical protein
MIEKVLIIILLSRLLGGLGIPARCTDPDPNLMEEQLGKPQPIYFDKYLDIFAALENLGNSNPCFYEALSSLMVDCTTTDLEEQSQVESFGSSLTVNS